VTASLPCLLTALPLARVEPNWIERAIEAVCRLFPADSFFNRSLNLQATVALVLVSLTCGAVGSLVVGGRMAFFSDALAHCAFAGVSIGFLLFTLLIQRLSPAADFWGWVTPIMVVFGVLVGFGIAVVRRQTGLSSDTVIGVFFAGAIGLAAALQKLMQHYFQSSRALFGLEDFLFGNLLLLRGEDLVYLLVVTLLTGVVLYFTYNSLMLGSFNTSLALSRRVPVRLSNYLFVMLLALIVNICLRTVGALLVNALLVVPAAAAVNVSRNLRALFWLTIGLCLTVSLLGQWASWEMAVRYHIDLGVSGVIILFSVAAFLLSMVVGPWYRSRPAS
jgi:zinc transport system permease protein